MNKKLHFIIAGESGRTRALALSARRLKVAAGLACLVLSLLTGMSIFGVGFYSRNLELSATVADLETALAGAHATTSGLEKQVADLRQEKALMLENAVGELNEKSRLIESILSTVGVEVREKESRSNSGGPFTALSESSPGDLIFKVDRYLETIQYIPLGAPVPGVVTSRYGRRLDPLNNKPAFHNGVDIRGRRGTEVKATADGKVFRSGYDQGYGWFVILEHGNGFRTMFGHLKKVLVKSGRQVSRGQVIGLLGSSGRSTGPHVHYEVHYRDKLVNPAKFMRIARYLDSNQQPPSEGGGLN